MTGYIHFHYDDDIIIHLGCKPYIERASNFLDWTFIKVWRQRDMRHVITIIEDINILHTHSYIVYVYTWSCAKEQSFQVSFTRWGLFSWVYYTRRLVEWVNKCNQVWIIRRSCWNSNSRLSTLGPYNYAFCDVCRIRTNSKRESKKWCLRMCKSVNPVDNGEKNCLLKLQLFFLCAFLFLG